MRPISSIPHGHAVIDKTTQCFELGRSMSCVLFNSVTRILGIKSSHIEFRQGRPCYYSKPSKPSKAIPGDIKQSPQSPEQRTHWCPLLSQINNWTRQCWSLRREVFHWRLPQMSGTNKQAEIDTHPSLSPIFPPLSPARVLPLSRLFLKIQKPHLYL